MAISDIYRSRRFRKEKARLSLSMQHAYSHAFEYITPLPGLITNLLIALQICIL